MRSDPVSLRALLERLDAAYPDAVSFGAEAAQGTQMAADLAELMRIGLAVKATGAAWMTQPGIVSYAKITTKGRGLLEKLRRAD